MENDRESLEWMRHQAKKIAPHLVKDDEGHLLCSRIIAGRVDELQDFVKDVVRCDSGDVLLLQRAKQLIR